MKKSMTLLTLSVMLLMVSCGKKENAETANADNPFLQTWDTPYGVPPFEKIKPEHYMPAFEEGMKQQKAEIDAIVNNEEAPTFENTIIPYEYSGQLLYNVTMVFFNLSSACNSDEMIAIAEEISPKLSAHGDDISLNKKLFERIKTIYDQRESLNLEPIDLRLLEETYNGFVRGGANIPEEKQARFREINSELSSLTLKFENNVLAATNNYKLVLDANDERIADMPQALLAAAQEEGNKSEETKGKCVFTLQMPSWEPFMQNCSNRELRKEMWDAYVYRCTEDSTSNTEIINKITNLRLERAQMFGYPSHAAFILDDNMAKTPEAVNNLLMQVWTPALQKAKEEAAEYQAMINKEADKFKLEAWDWRYYSEKLRREKYNLNDAEVTPYFSLENVREGAFAVANKLFGITFEKNSEIPTYYEGVDAFEVKENGEVIAILYMDYYPRESKASGAWMTNFREQYYTREGENVIPIVSLVLNSSKPVGDTPSLLNFDQVSTLFHEFGHGLHGILTDCKYRSLSGTNVARDFVELPSQIMENWACEPEVMKMYAKHYQTGEIIPDELIHKIEASGTYGQGFINTELIAASLLDMSYHTITAATEITLPEFEDAAMGKIGLIPEIISRYKSTYFKHIFSGGYSSGYYGYTWAAVLDSDAFQAFKETSLFDAATAKSYRENILEKGNTEDPMTLYVRFRGHEPSIEPLLTKRGLK